jgi:TatD DNase family protein
MKRSDASLYYLKKEYIRIYAVVKVFCMYQATKILSDERQKAIGLSDAHCHLNLFDSPNDILRMSAAQGLRLIIATGGSRKDNAQVINLLKNDMVFAAIGISPDFVKTDHEHIGQLKRLIEETDKVVAIGEIGLDFKIAKDQKEIDMQREAFEKQLDISKDLDLPVVVHSRNAVHEVLDTLRNESIKRALFHFFEGGEEEAKELEKRGYLLSVPPVETNKRRAAIGAIGLRNLVVETDSPIVGKTPSDVRRSLEIISKIKGIEFNDIANITTRNLREYLYLNVG